MVAAVADAISLPLVTSIGHPAMFDGAQANLAISQVQATLSSSPNPAPLPSHQDA